MADVLVIGGGAAGMAAAIVAAEKGEQTVLLEKMDRVGKKLLATGNGRCNLMNTGAPRYPCGDSFARAVLARCGVKEQTLFWQNHGLRMREEEGGRVYPSSGQATTVLDVLRLAMEEARVQVQTGVAVKGLERRGKGWRVLTSAGSMEASRVILAGGGCAQPKLGSDGSCYVLLTRLGHRLVTPRPALTQIETETEAIRGLEGIRVRCAVSLTRKGRTLKEEQGEALFASYGLSGVCVMQCAREAQKGDEMRLNLLWGLGMDEKEARDELLRRQSDWADQPMEKLLTGLCVPRLALAVCKAAGVYCRARRVGDLKRDEAARLAQTLGAFGLQITGVKGFDTAQVTAGGIAVEEFNPHNLSSRVAPGLHAAGEVLNVDGDCGGFNLMFAFGSGLLAGQNDE